jgi:DNA repair protein RadC
VRTGWEIGSQVIPGKAPEPARHDLAKIMKIYEAKLRYELVQDGPREALNTPERVVTYMQGAFDEAPVQEAFYVICLNRKNRPMGRHRVSLGTATSCLAAPREIFRVAVLAGAVAIICVHNHPSGDPSPSAADLQLTRQVRDAGKVMDIELIDHLIIGNKEDDPRELGFHSLRQAGVI